MAFWLPKGEYCWICIPLLLLNSTKERCWSQGWSSIWWAAGTTLLFARRRSSSAFEKLEMPMAFVLPVLRRASMARQVSR